MLQEKVDSTLKMFLRGTETEDVIRKRINRAAQESRSIVDYDYIIVNDDVDECASRLHSLIRAQRQRVKSNLAFVRRLQEELEDLSEKENE